MAGLVNGAIQIPPRTFHLDVRLIYMRYTTVTWDAQTRQLFAIHKIF
jgi:hypothetical protein